MKHKIHLLTSEERAFVAGFLEGDGSIFALIVRRHDYRLKYQIKTTVNFTQKSCRSWFLVYLQSKFGCGVIRDREDGCHELAVNGNELVEPLLKALSPYLVMKNKTAHYVLRVIDSLGKKQSPKSFLESCLLVDKVAALNDSKNRTVTSDTVLKTFLELSLIVPVETSVK